MINSKDIRQQFIDFFVEKGHKFIPSSSVVPTDDPTLLFTNAGMNQFKDIFLGIKESEVLRAVNSQKCIRAGGKHNDLDEVGKDGYHHTFFEMLGNWSFGEYYKKEAITWAWELFTDVWKLPKSLLHATVYKTDDEAFDIWKESTDINPEHITRHGEKDNFWEMGETGPCGPCSEIHIDRGEEFCNLKHINGHICKVNGDCHRYIELWNLVFMQYQRQEDKSLKPLKNKFVDTGAGFERVCQVLQNVKSNYDTDIFQPIIQEIVKISGIAYSEETGVSHRVIADHIRTLSFAIADGGLPSNEGRGYVLRRILRRAARYGRNLNLTEPFLHKLIDIVIATMGEHFKELNERTDFIKTIVKNEEERFNQTLDKGLSLFEELLKSVKDKKISGKDAFVLYDTYGFPFDLTVILAEENGMNVDENEFNIEMEKQKERARSASHFKINMEELNWIDVNQNNNNHSNFIGYELNTSTVNVLKYALNDNDNSIRLILDKTPFYAESGGQVADKGFMHNDKCELQITNVQKEADTFIHFAILKKGHFADIHKALKEPFIAMIETTYRKSIARNHTATHLLHSALKKVLGDHVQQKGSLVQAEMLRFDFTHYSAMSEEQLQQVESIVNDKIKECFRIVTEVKTIDDAKNEGATALFGEKYGDTVRVVSVNNNNECFSKELCGGTHVQNTGEIGIFKILSESSSSAGVRRIEAITGVLAEDYYKNCEEIVKHISKKLTGKIDLNHDNLIEKLDKLLKDNKFLQTELDKFKLQNSADVLDSLIKEKRLINDVNVVIGKISVENPEELKIIGDKLKEKINSGIGILLSVLDLKVSIIVVVSNDLIKKYQAGKIVSELVKVLGGRGGGRPDMAMAGGRLQDNNLNIEQEFLSILENILI